MNHKNQKGSIVLMILVFITVLGAITYSLLRTNSYYISLAHERENYEKQYQLARALYDFIVIKHADKVEDDIKAIKYVIFEGPWPDASSGYSGKAWIDLKKKMIHVELQCNKKTVIHNTHKA